MTKLSFHNEGGFRSAERFLAQFMPEAAAVLGAHLGRQSGQPVHVILSDRQTHERRFPAQIAQARILEALDSGEIEELSHDDGGPEAAAVEQYATRNYAHGIATRVTAARGASPRAVVDEPAIYLDIETITELAAEHSVSPESMLAKVAVHELAHVYRGHIHGPTTAIHGWFAEGDAQRDAWHVLTEMLSRADYSPTVRSARAAQVRLALVQPPAYRQFPVAAGEWSGLLSHHPPDETSAWAVRPQRDPHILIHEGDIELPLKDGMRMPGIEDRVYLHRYNIVAGPWFVVARTAEPLLAHPRDLEAVDAERKERTMGKPPSFVWLQLRPAPAPYLKSGESPAGRIPPSTLWANRLDAHDELLRQLTTDARSAAQEWAKAETAGLREMWVQLGRSADDIDHDPFNDWPSSSRVTPASARGAAARRS